MTHIKKQQITTFWRLYDNHFWFIFPFALGQMFHILTDSTLCCLLRYFFVHCHSYGGTCAGQADARCSDWMDADSWFNCFYGNFRCNSCRQQASLFFRKYKLKCIWSTATLENGGRSYDCNWRNGITYSRNYKRWLGLCSFDSGIRFIAQRFKNISLKFYKRRLFWRSFRSRKKMMILLMSEPPPS